MPKYQKEKKKGWHPLGTETELSTTKRNWLKFNFKMKPHSQLVPSAAPVSHPLTFPPCHRSAKVSGVTFASAKKATMHSLNLNKWQRTNSNKHCRTNRPTPTHAHTQLLIYTVYQIESLLALRQIERFNFSNRHNWHFARLQTNMPGNTKYTHLLTCRIPTHTHAHTQRKATLGVTGQSRFSHHSGLLLVTPAQQGEGCRDYSTAIYLQLCISVCMWMYVYVSVCVCLLQVLVFPFVIRLPCD